MTRLLIVLALILLCVGTAFSQTAIRIDHTPNGTIGELTQVEILIDNADPALPLGGFDLLLRHHHALELQSAQMGSLLLGCQWEYFNWSTPHFNTVRLVALAETNNGPIHPLCHATGSGVLANLTFSICNDGIQEGDYLQIQWIWYECGDNAASSLDGTDLYVSDQVYDFAGGYHFEITEDSLMPSPFGAPDECLPEDSTIVRRIDFYNGGVYLGERDIEPPVLTCPEDMTVNTDPGQCGAVVDYVVTLTDNCPGAVMSCIPFSGSFMPLGTTTIDCAAVDTAGNYVECEFTITVEDHQSPELSCPDSIVVSATPGECTGAIDYVPEVTDNCYGVNVSAFPSLDTEFEVGVTELLLIATDPAGNYDGCYIDVVVLDEESPVLTCPADIVVDNTPGECGAEVDFDLLATDNCEVAVVTSNPPSGSFFEIGAHVVQAVAVDNAGNADTCEFSVTVKDTEPPMAVCPGDITVFNDSGSYGAVVVFNVDATDNCVGVSVAAAPPSGTFFESGQHSVETVARDASGNADTCEFTVIVKLNDPDGDGRPSWDDNCPDFANSDQLDADADGLGDVCDECTDTDGDGYGDAGFAANTCMPDNCPATPNPDQLDADTDGLGDICDECTDTDGDGYGDPGFAANACILDNCPSVPNLDQRDADADGIGDVCDECTDTDDDGYGDPGFAANTCVPDNCPSLPNPDQSDADADGSGDECDECTDTDGDGYGDPGFAANTCGEDNCPSKANPDQSDADSNGLGDACCCTGLTIGNVDGSPDDLVTMSDLTALIDQLFVSLGSAGCVSEANVDLSSDKQITMGDLTILIDHLFINLTPLPACPQ